MSPTVAGEAEEAMGPDRTQIVLEGRPRPEGGLAEWPPWFWPQSAQGESMPSKFAQFLTDNTIDPRRVLIASRALERLRPEDRQLKLKQKQARGEDAPAGGDDKNKQRPPKPRSGRPVTPRLLREATEGKPISGPAKNRLLRAINRVLEKKKKKPADLRALF